MSAGIYLQILQTLLAVAMAPLLMGWLNQCRAWLLGRRAPPLLQPYRTLRKLFRKEVVMAHDASPLYHFAPYAFFSCMALAAGIVPTLANDLPFSPAADVIALVGIFSLARVFMALAAMDVGTSFGTLGARREMLVAFLAEPALLMVFFNASLICGSTQLTTIVDTLAHKQFAIHPSLAFAGVAFMMISIAENARIPVDNPTTHLELTMIHEAMILEYSGRQLAMIEWAVALKLLTYSTLGLALFLPWGIAAVGDWWGLLPAVAAFLAKMMAGAAALALIEVLFAKVRLFRVPEYMGAAFLLAVLGVLTHFLVRGGGA